jgi:hypothetical protein
MKCYSRVIGGKTLLPLGKIFLSSISKVLTPFAAFAFFRRRWTSASDSRQSFSTGHLRPPMSTQPLNRTNNAEQLRLFRPGVEQIIYCVTSRVAELPTPPVNRAAFSPLCCDRRIYIASKVTHAEKWRRLRDEGWPVISTWIDEAGEGESKSLANLATRCIDEARSCTDFILYSEPGDVLKGALLECGAALANGVPVYGVGTGPSISRVFENHPCWRICDTVEDALCACLQVKRTPPHLHSISTQACQ